VKSAYAALAASVVLVLTTGVRVVRETPLPAPPPGSPELPVPQLGQRVASQPWNAVRAVERDPFHPGRTAPAARYLLPEEDMRATLPGASSVRGEVTLLGTAVSGDGGGFVMCQFARATPEVVRIGEEIGGLTLRAIAPGTAEFTSRDGSTVTLHVAGALAATTSPSR
jgi:hypothetical protein